jgi:hypothetical protein
MFVEILAKLISSPLELTSSWVAPCRGDLGGLSSPPPNLPHSTRPQDYKVSLHLKEIGTSLSNALAPLF